MDTTGFAAGKVVTGFSMPAVALYSAVGTTVTYSQGRRLARGVGVTLDVSDNDENKFHADNVTAETAPRKFKEGTLQLTVDGLLIAARKLIMGLPAARTITIGTTEHNLYGHGDAQTIPYVGVGYITRYMSNGITSFVPTIVPKVRFAQISQAANTQEEDIDWQTQALSAAISRDDTAYHDWLIEGDDYATEAEAWAVIQAVLNFTEA